MTTPAHTIDAPAVAEELAQLEAAFELPAVEPTRTLAPGACSRRAVAVQRAVAAGLAPAELLAIVLFATLAAGVLAMFALELS